MDQMTSIKGISMSNISNQFGKNQYFEWKLLIEAALFKAGKEISIEELSIGLKTIPKKIIIKIINELISDYNSYDSAIEIYQFSSNSFGMQVKTTIMHEVGVIKFTEQQKFKPNEIKTLAFIAYNQPIELQDVVDFIGKAAKKSVNSLKKEGFVNISINSYNALNEAGEEVKIKTKVISTTKIFADYLGIPNEKNLIKKKIQDFIDSQ
ncbi:Segregation and condensation protein B [Candidatus Lokiarchaeum ossiferum]|uniref:Segregation and condensation protein B n=2 Tax=Candidatus Lokiarchaeum ossiferum TaxID=2951803 RepID=A0ABY6HR75_9ARCH|nr:Segregation and condensation protein B [Candidatus Lokiarchaeum sp. B-35]